jgi:hypothetical protein
MMGKSDARDDVAGSKSKRGMYLIESRAPRNKVGSHTRTGLKETPPDRKNLLAPFEESYIRLLRVNG